MRKYFFATASLLILSACAPIMSRHGFVLDKGTDMQVEPAKDNKTTLISRYGNPTQIAMFDQETWYYISSQLSQKAFYKPKTINRQITAIYFEDGNSVSEVKTYTLADGRIISYDKGKTPTRGREVTFIEQIFGSVGRAPIQLPGQDVNLPSSAGGPRRQ